MVLWILEARKGQNEGVNDGPTLGEGHVLAQQSPVVFRSGLGAPQGPRVHMRLHVPLLLGVLEDPGQHQMLILLGDKEEAWGACPRRSPGP